MRSSHYPFTIHIFYMMFDDFVSHHHFRGMLLLFIIIPTALLMVVIQHYGTGTIWEYTVYSEVGSAQEQHDFCLFNFASLWWFRI